MQERDYLQKAEDYARKGDVKEALTTLKRAVESQPDSWRAMLMMGQILVEVGHAEMAVSPLRRAKQLNPDEFEIRLALGNALGRDFALEEGIIELEAAEAMRPNDDEVLRNLGWMRCMSGEVEKGRETLQRALKIDPQNALIYNDLAASYLYTDDQDLMKAQDFCLRALELEPSHPFFLETWKVIQEKLREED